MSSQLCTMIHFFTSGSLLLHEWSIQVVNQGLIQAVWETGILICAPKLWHPKNTFQVLFFQLYFNKKYVEVAIIDYLEMAWKKNNET